MLRVAVYNKSARVTDDQMRLMVLACQTQLAAHVAPAWDRLPPSVVFREREDEASDDANFADPVIPFFIFDSPDAADVLGYHSEGVDGQFYSKIFVNPVLDNGGGILDGGRAGVSVSSVLSHELAEWFIDPSCNVWVDGPTIPEGSCYAYESSDPVQGTTYEIVLPDGTKVLVENFVTSAWFDLMAPANVRRDWCGVVKASFQLGPGGYCIVRREPGDEKSIWGAQIPPEWRMEAKSVARGRTFRRTGR